MKQNNWVSSPQASELLVKQLATWPLAAQNYCALESVRSQSFDLGGCTVHTQFNPARALSSGAKVDARSLRERKCFLCPENLPVEQERLPFGLRYLVLCNPYPIFTEHFTIPSREHAPQRILSRIDDFLELTRRLDRFTLFYNGPRCGASAPDHAHFQAVTRGVMPLDREVVTTTSDTSPRSYAADHRIAMQQTTAKLCGTAPLSYAVPCHKRYCDSLLASSDDTPEARAKLHLLIGNLRPGFIIVASEKDEAANLFRHIYAALPVPEGEDEPMMNLFGMYNEGRWLLTLIPRRRHRPWQYEAEGKDHLLSSPGAADIGGLFITPLEEDFEKITPALLTDVYQQVCLSDQEVEDIFVHLSTK